MSFDEEQINENDPREQEIEHLRALVHQQDAEINHLRKDAERLDWLTRKQAGLQAGGKLGSFSWFAYWFTPVIFEGEVVDAIDATAGGPVFECPRKAIDAAMAHDATRTAAATDGGERT